MNKKVLILPILIIGVAIWLVKSESNEQPQIKASEIGVVNQKSSNIEFNLGAQTKAFGVVEVEVIPTQVNEEEPMVFKLALNNHSISLDYDLTKIAYLNDDLGNVYKANEWTGGVGGHHLRGELVFDNLKSGVKSLTLNIDGIDNKSNKFEWRLPG